MHQRQSGAQSSSESVTNDDTPIKYEIKQSRSYSLHQSLIAKRWWATQALEKKMNPCRQYVRVPFMQIQTVETGRQPPITDKSNELIVRANLLDLVNQIAAIELLPKVACAQRASCAYAADGCVSWGYQSYANSQESVAEATLLLSKPPWALPHAHGRAHQLTNRFWG